MPAVIPIFGMRCLHKRHFEIPGQRKKCWRNCRIEKNAFKEIPVAILSARWALNLLLRLVVRRCRLDRNFGDNRGFVSASVVFVSFVTTAPLMTAGWPVASQIDRLTQNTMVRVSANLERLLSGLQWLKCSLLHHMCSFQYSLLFSGK